MEGIRQGFYDWSRQYLLRSVDGIMKRLQTDDLDVLLIHRPDVLVEPEEVAAAFDKLEQSGKVRHFGVSNHEPMQIKLLKRFVRQSLIIDQLQFGIPVTNIVANGMEVNMDAPGAIDRAGSILDYSRLNDISIQTWSPFQAPNWGGCFLGDNRYGGLNRELDMLVAHYCVSATTVAAAWILRHPAQIQLIAGTSKESRLKEITQTSNLQLTREEWDRLYLVADHPLP